jgi:hypothetical protein
MEAAFRELAKVRLTIVDTYPIVPTSFTATPCCEATYNSTDVINENRIYTCCLSYLPLNALPPRPPTV